MSAVDVPRAAVDDAGEDPDYLSQQLVTYIGNKRALLGNIALALERVKARLGKTKLHALQVSARGGELHCELRGERVFMAGRAVRYLEGTIEIPG